MTTLVDLSPISHVIPEDPEPTSLDLHNKLLRWHYHLRHLPFEQIMQLANGTTSQATPSQQETILCRMPIWEK